MTSVGSQSRSELKNKHKLFFEKIWRRSFEGLDVGDEASAWLSKKLGEEIRLVWFLQSHCVKSDQKWARRAKNDDASNAQDLASFHVLSKVTVGNFSFAVFVRTALEL